MDYRQALEADVADLWTTIDKIHKVLRVYSWLGNEEGEFQDEFNNMCEELTTIIDSVKHPAQQRYWDMLSGRR